MRNMTWQDMVKEYPNRWGAVGDAVTDGLNIRSVSVSVTVPETMVPYLVDMEPEQIFARNAMILYPLIRDLTISHGRAAEILGVRKTDLIEFYDSMGIPYLNQSKEELLADLAALDKVLGE